MAYIEEHQYSIWEEGWKQPKPPMNVLVACEESQAVCKAFRARGHNAYSCDIQECSGGHPEWHICGDALELIQPTFRFYEHGEVTDRWIQFRTQDGEVHENRFWDLIIAHPPCTYLSNAGARWLWKGNELNQERYKKGLAGRDFFMQFFNADCPKIAIENPIPSAVYELPEPSQVIEPYQFGHEWSKKTCLWLKGLPQLLPTINVPDHRPYVSSGSYSRSHDPKFLGTSRAGGGSEDQKQNVPRNSCRHGTAVGVMM